MPQGHPNPPENSAWYLALARFFDQEHMARLEPRIRNIAGQLHEPRNAGGEAEIVGALVTPLVFRSLCTLLGWPAHQWNTLAVWVQDNQEQAARIDASDDTVWANSFAALVKDNLDAHRATPEKQTSATGQLLQTTVNSQRLTDETITAILRNWVAGHGTTADALGIVLTQVAQDSRLQDHLRRSPALVPAAVEEILRMDGPLVVNRDPLAFRNPSDFNLNRDRGARLVWGHDIHLCMGAPLARLEIRVALEELLARTTGIELVDAEPVRKAYPGNGYAKLKLRLAVEGASVTS